MSFDALAPIYGALETAAFGRALQRARVEFLPQVRQCRRALVVGEGNGSFVAALARENAQVQIDCIEQSAAMLRQARKRVGSSQRIRWLQTDVRSWHTKTLYDLIVTHFFLDCFSPNEAREIVAQIAARAAAGAYWLIAEFHLPSSGARRAHALIWLRAMYAFFRLTTGITTHSLADFAQLLAAAGFELIEKKDAHFSLIRTQLWRRSSTPS